MSHFKFAFKKTVYDVISPTSSPGSVSEDCEDHSPCEPRSSGKDFSYGSRPIVIGDGDDSEPIVIDSDDEDDVIVIEEEEKKQDDDVVLVEEEEDDVMVVEEEGDFVLSDEQWLSCQSIDSPEVLPLDDLDASSEMMVIGEDDTDSNEEPLSCSNDGDFVLSDEEWNFYRRLRYTF